MLKRFPPIITGRLLFPIFLWVSIITTPYNPLLACPFCVHSPVLHFTLLFIFFLPSITCPRCSSRHSYLFFLIVTRILINLLNILIFFSHSIPPQQIWKFLYYLWKPLYYLLPLEFLLPSSTQIPTANTFISYVLPSRVCLIIHTLPTFFYSIIILLFLYSLLSSLQLQTVHNSLFHPYILPV